ncbi:MAG: hypothetical protein AAFN77_19610 [Planctomycetota bacterium]
MSKNQVIGHETIRQRFNTSAERGRLAGTYLFLGPDGVGKRTFALNLAEAILCEANETKTLEPCGACSGCLQVRNQTHSDLLLVSKPKDKNVLPLDLFIGRSTHRRREGLVYEIGMKPFRGGFRIAIIDDADYFNQESANCLLKTLEEPPPKSLLILLGTSQQRQLHTIVSRSQLVRFQSLTPSEIVQVIEQKQLLESMETNQPVEQLASIAEGSVSRAIALANPETFEFRTLLFQRLASGDPHANEFSKAVVAFAEASGKEGYRRRPRLVLAGELAVEFFRSVYLQLTGVESNAAIEPDVENLVNAVASTFSQYPDEGAIRLGRCIDRTGEMQFHSTTNAQFLNVVESWLVDIGRLLRGESVSTGKVLSGTI